MNRGICQDCQHFTPTGSQLWLILGDPDPNHSYVTGECNHPKPALGGAAQRDGVACWLSCYQFKARKCRHE